MSIRFAGADHLGHTFKLYYADGPCGMTFMHLVIHLIWYVSREDTWMELPVW